MWSRARRPASAGPSSASPAAQEAELLDLGSEQEEQPDWSALDPEQACAVHVTQEVVETLEADLEDDAAIQSARSAATVEVRVALCDLPAFLKVAHGEGMPKDAVLDQVRAMKARGVEHVRYRSVNTPDDIESKAKISRMRGIVYGRQAVLAFPAGRVRRWALCQSLTARARDMLELLCGRRPSVQSRGQSR